MVVFWRLEAGEDVIVVVGELGRFSGGGQVPVRGAGCNKISRDAVNTAGRGRRTRQ